MFDRRRHPFYEHSNAAFFLATVEGRVVGRISAIHNRRYTAAKDDPTGFVGHFESVPDFAVAERLFATAGRWLAGRGLSQVIGPRGLAGFDGAVLVDGFDHRAVVGVPWNPPYYDELFAAAGFEPWRDYLSGWFPGNHRLDQRVVRAADRVMERRGYRVRRFADRADLERFVPELARVLSRAMEGLATFVAPTDRELQATVTTLRRVIPPRCVKVLERNGQAVGFVLSYPDIAAQVRHGGGRLWPLEWVRLLGGVRSSRDYVINGMGLVPEERGSGASAILYTSITRTLQQELGVRRVEVVQVAADNHASLRDMGSLGVQWHKRHRHYRRKL